MPDEPASPFDPLPDSPDDEDGRLTQDELEDDDSTLEASSGRDTSDEDLDDEDLDDDDLDDEDLDDEDIDGEDRDDEEGGDGFWERNIGRRLGGMSDVVKRAVAGSVGSLFLSEDGLKQHLTELKLPKELIGFIVQQSDNAKREFMKLVAGEIREFMEHTDFYDELKKILTSLSFEIRTEIRLIPNDEAFVKPEINNEVTVKRNVETAE